MESGEVPALDPELSDPGARSSGAVRGHEHGAVCPGACNALCSLPSALAV